MQRPRRPTRRRWLVCLGAGAAALAGCSESEDPAPDGASTGAQSASESQKPTTRGATGTESRRPTTTGSAPVTETTDATTGTTVTEPEIATARPTPSPAPTTIHADYETTEVRAVDAEGEVLGRVTAAIADTPDLRYLGLSDTESLPNDRGMLFVYDSEGQRTFVMRRMDFGIDIVYAAADGEITRIHHAPAPGPNEDGSEQRYPGYGQYVLEVNYEWTADHGVSEGDYLEFEL